ncbi:MAG: radical SAM protein [Patescibacteria group bacterium]
MRLPAGEIKKRAKIAQKKLAACDLCPRQCRADRTNGQTGFCGAADRMIISHIGLHHGEEPPLSGTRGSGAVFFTYCNLHCCYCQNWQISHPPASAPQHEYTPHALAAEMVKLQKQGAHNINLVSPSHYVPQIIASLHHAILGGLEIPIIYNTNGYDSVETLRLLDGIIDIYLPDLKYAHDAMAKKYSQAINYALYNQSAIKEMYRQVGRLKLDAYGIATQGLIVRHLVLPGNIAGSQASLEFLAGLSPDIHLSLMSQYRPEYRATRYPELNRKINSTEYDKALANAEHLGLSNGWRQEFESNEMLFPDFEKSRPFNWCDDDSNKKRTVSKNQL